METRVKSEISITPGELIRQLAAHMHSHDLDWEDTPSWTNALKKSLTAILQTTGSNITDVLYSDSDERKQEFLLDVVAWDRSEGEGITLAVESEWSQSLADVEYDFWKLLVVKAPVKLMLFACNKNPRTFSQEAVWDRLAGCLKLYRHHVCGERYVFMDYAPSPGRRAWWIEIPETGRMNTIPERNWVDFE